MSEPTPSNTDFEIKPLTDEQVKQMEEFSRGARKLQDQILKRRKGKPFPPSWRLIRKSREERSKRI